MKLWLDDVRPAAEGWTWARTVEDAIALLLDQPCTEASLDHDLGASPADGMYARGDSPNGCGCDVVDWMISFDVIPPIVRIHSWNPSAAERMALALRRSGAPFVFVEPYRVP